MVGSWSLAISQNFSKLLSCFCSHSRNDDVVYVSVRSSEIVLLDVIDSPLEIGHIICDSKRKSAKRKELTVSFESRVEFIVIPGGYLVFGILQVQRIIVFEARNFVDEIKHPRKLICIEMGESVDDLSLINN